MTGRDPKPPLRTELPPDIHRSLVLLPDQSTPIHVDSLRTASATVTDFGSALRSLVEALIGVRKHIPYAGGVSAIQLGVPLRVCALFVGPGAATPLILVNPLLSRWSRRTGYRREGCLSLPGRGARVPRPERVEILARSADNATVHLSLAGYSAAVAQHELDHLDGILYFDRLEPGIWPTLFSSDEPRGRGDD